MAAPARDRTDFDPLVDLAGLWTPDLAERYLPIPGVPSAKYECVAGKLVMSPCEGGANSRAMVRLAVLMEEAADVAGFFLYSRLNVQLGPQSWIEPDFTVLSRDIGDDTWIQPADVTLVGEFVSPSSRRRDRIDKPALCAGAGIPYFMAIEVDRDQDFAQVKLFRLAGAQHQLLATAREGQRFATDVPFSLSFDPARLLTRG